MEYRFKVILLGEYSCGKTSILKRINGEAFYDHYLSTIGVDYFRKTYNNLDIFNDSVILDDNLASYEITREKIIPNFKPKNKLFKKYHSLLKRTPKDEINYNLSIWDTSGQEKFTFITTAYYRNVTCAVFVFDLSNYDTFREIEKWHKSLFNHLDKDAHAYFPFVVVGNKADLKSSRTISYKEADEYVSKLGGYYLEVSAKDNNNIDKIFQTLVKTIIFNINHELVIPCNLNGVSVFSKGDELFPKDIRKLDDEVKEDIDIKSRCCTIM